MLYIDLATLRLQRRLSGYPVESITLKRGSLQPIEIQFVRDCAVVELAATAVGSLIFKARGTYNVPSAVVFTTAWTKTGTSTATVYTFTPDLTGVALDAALGNADSATFAGEIQWLLDPSTLLGARPIKTVNQWNAIVNNANRGGETLAIYPTTADVIVLTDITRLVGGVSPTDLDAIPLAAYPPLTVFEIELAISGARGASRYQKVPWPSSDAPVSDAAHGLVATLDFNASTNRFVLRRVEGL